MMTISDNIEQLQTRIAQAATKAGRATEDITLIAVSKQKPVDAIVAAHAAGLRHFGENRAAELAEKAGELANLTDIKWHFIGQLQSRQSKPIAQCASVFHAVDRVKIAQRLSKQLAEEGRGLPVFIEVNVSGEESKSGFSCGDWEKDGAERERLLEAVTTIAALPNIAIQGVMTMAPWEAEEAEIRSIFQRTRQLSEWLESAAPQASWSQLSMGMTNDFEIAIEEGSTHIRVGRAIFGARAY